MQIWIAQLCFDVIVEFAKMDGEWKIQRLGGRRAEQWSHLKCGVYDGHSCQLLLAAPVMPTCARHSNRHQHKHLLLLLLLCCDGQKWQISHFCVV